MGKIVITLGQRSIQNAIAQLDSKNERIRKACDTFVERLADVGITVAKGNAKNYGEFILFSKYVNVFGKDDHTAIMYAQKKTDLVRKWFKDGGIETSEIDPLLMEEFGSGWKAVVPTDIVVYGVGQGSFPRPGAYENATNPKGWYWTTPDGVHHHSMGEAPGQPMYNARESMYLQIQTIAREVFRNVV